MSPRHVRLAAYAANTIPQASHLVFRSDLNGGVTPQVGTGGTFARASEITYPGSTAQTGMVVAASGAPATPAFAYTGAGTRGGMQFQGARRNRTLRSDMDSGGWGHFSGSETRVDAAATAPDNTTTATQFTTTAGNQGCFQDEATAAANQLWVASFWVRVASGTLAMRISIRGSSGGTPENQDYTFTATTTWQRVYGYKAFTGAATGNIRSILFADAAGTFLCWGAQCEIVSDTGVTGGEMKTPSPLIQTVAAEVTTVSDDLTYPSSNISAALAVGTISLWVNTPWNEADFATTTEKLFLSMSDLQLAIGNDGTGGNFVFNFGSASNRILDVADTWTRNVWRHYVVAWDNSGAAISAQAYRNATQIGTNTTATPTTPTAATFALGGPSTATDEEKFMDGIVANVKWWKTKLSATEIAALHNSEKGVFGL